MNLLIALVVGTALGAFIGWWFRRNFDYLVLDILVGLGGAILGLGTYYFMHIGELSFWSFGGVLAAVAGAGICLLIYQLILLKPKKKRGSFAQAGKKEKEEEE